MTDLHTNSTDSRRRFLQRAGTATALAPLIASAGETAEKSPTGPPGKADNCILLWLGGGACHIDTWDPKRKGDGKKIAGSFYDSIPTAVPGVRVCEHLKRSAALLDRCVLLRGVHHEVIDEHAAATNRMHTGRPPSGTTIYPSIGSVVAHQRGTAGDGVPPYVVASDRTLREIVLDRPTTDAELQQIHGIGATKAERYGEGLLAVVRRWLERTG